jgi:hypothetical protein
LIDPVDPGWKRKAHAFTVDDQQVRRTEGGGFGFLRPAFMFERDEYVFINFSTGF